MFLPEGKTTIHVGANVVHCKFIFALSHVNIVNGRESYVNMSDYRE